MDDVHSFDTGFLKAMERLDELDTSDENKATVKKFIKSCRRDGLAKSTLTHYTNQLKRMIQRLPESGFEGTIDKLDEDAFYDFIIYLEDEAKLSHNEIRNYKKVVRKLYRHIHGDDVPGG
ncbi:phage integrase N-terminal SAM-like domain-containing protein [Methanolobus psychrotolerans]|uniref:phage integrase N-terminal SAM-like domain-containing protein n=1 Tax=Methanolobus psychrotolerans TaxID=1874706 RepID=UPI001F5D6FD9|nr:phage integrase N-terminal SAM-like domain-containing protein [Methanolobus psychrotolerans]